MVVGVSLAFSDALIATVGIVVRRAIGAVVGKRVHADGRLVPLATGSAILVESLTAAIDVLLEATHSKTSGVLRALLTL